LQEISELRLSAAAHLTIAAAAMDEGRPDLAKELIEAQQRDMARLRERAEELLVVDGAEGLAQEAVLRAAVLEESALQESTVTSSPRGARRRARHATGRHAATAVLPARRSSSSTPAWSGAGALLAVAVTVVIALAHPFAPSHHEDVSPASLEASVEASVRASLDANVNRSYNQLKQTAKPAAPARKVEEATTRLHGDLQRLLDKAKTDPAAAHSLLLALVRERQLLTKQHPSTLVDFKPEADRILTVLRSSTSPEVQAVLSAPDAVAAIAASTADLPLAVVAPQPAPPPTAPSSGSSSAGGGADPPAEQPTAGVPAPVDTPPTASDPAPPVDNTPPVDDTPSKGGSSGGSVGTGDNGAAAKPDTAEPTGPQLPAPPVLGSLSLGG
jgi:hypothetical protein